MALFQLMMARNLIIETFFSLKESFPNLRLILVPRHQTGVARAESFLQDIQGSYALKTNLSPDLHDFTPRCNAWQYYGRN